MGVPDADGDVLEVDEEREPLLVLLVAACQETLLRVVCTRTTGIPGEGARRIRGRGETRTVSYEVLKTKEFAR
jgi:hypothetical protein